MRAVSPRVDLLVSEGDRPVDYVMPSLVGLAEADARTEIADAGLKIGNVNVVAASPAVKDTVVAETPAAGARVSADVAIDLDVAP
jgi:beta-lactam-binding protein with PASTA domain